MLGCCSQSIRFESVGSFIWSAKDGVFGCVDDLGDDGDVNEEVLVSGNEVDSLAVDLIDCNDGILDDVAEVIKLFAPLDAAIAAAAARAGDVR